MFKKNHYVPILKWKQGEQKALEALSSQAKANFTPLIEIPPIDWDFETEQFKKNIDEHLSKFGDLLNKSWGSKDPVFVDLLYVDPNDRMANGSHPIEFIGQEVRKRGLTMIPVTSSDRDLSFQSEVKSIMSQDKLGVCFRLTDIDFDDLQNKLDSLLAALQTTPDNVDLVIDYKYLNPTDRTRTALFLSGLLNSIPYYTEWRNVILTGTSFPKNLSDVSAKTIDMIERSEWIIWKRLTQTKLDRLPIFGDYAIANPEPFEGDPRFINMSANIRYTAMDKFIIFKGQVIKRYGAAQYHTLAAQVVAHPEYSGKTFSVGDSFIDDVANQTGGPGSATSWRTAGTNHHISYVLNELATLSLP